jgi:hypothetical protein
MADFARGQGTRVVDSLSALPDPCDAVLAQDVAVAGDLSQRYTDGVRLLVMHSPHHALQGPPAAAGFSDAVIVLNDRLRRHAEQRAGDLRVVRLHQPIDLKRFVAKSRVRVAGKGPRALLMANNLDDVRRGIVSTACRSAGIERREVGAVAEPSPTPEHAIADVDIVISLGRGILEAMAGGRAAYVFGPAGGDGWVTPDSYPMLESDGFGGRATPLKIDAGRLASDLADWSEEMGEVNRDLVWAHHDGDLHATELLELIGPLGGRPAAPVEHADELARLVRLEWYSHANVHSALNENRRLRAEIETLRRYYGDAEDRVQQLEAALADADARFRALTATRRYRLASGLARPLDKLRRIAR